MMAAELWASCPAAVHKERQEVGWPAVLIHWRLIINADGMY